MPHPFFELDHPTLSAAALVAGAREQGVLVNALGPTRLRFVTHLDVDATGCERAGEVLGSLLG